MSNIYNMTDVWNAIGTTWTAIKMTVTDTASAAGSRLMDLLVGSTSMFSVDKAGKVTAADNFVIGTAGKGVDFSVNANAAGMTSELLAWYEEGAWTPADASGAGLSLTVAASDCFYTRIGRKVFVSFGFTFPATGDTSTLAISGLPFTVKNVTDNGINSPGISYTNFTTTWLSIYSNKNATTFGMRRTGGTAMQNIDASAKEFRGEFSYTV